MRIAKRVSAGLALLVAVALLFGCGGGASKNSIGGGSGGGGALPPPPPPPVIGQTAILINLGDPWNGSSGEIISFTGDPWNAISGQIVSFKLTFDSLTFRSANGDVQLLPNPRRFELSRRSLSSELLLLRKVSQGTYNSLTIGVSNPEVSFIDSNGVLHENVAASLTSATATIGVPLSISSTPMAINLIPVAGSVNFDGSNVISVTPQFNLSAVTLPSTDGGKVEGLVGTVLNPVSDGFFEIDADSAAILWDPVSPFTIAVDSNTEFQAVTGFGELAPGINVEVNAVAGTDGRLLANTVNLESNADAIVVEGLALSLGTAQLQMLVHKVVGFSRAENGYLMPGVGKALTVNANVTTQFQVVPDDVDLNNLDFTPTFDALTIAPGQNVRAVAADWSDKTMTASQLKLRKQSLNGTAGAVSAGSVSGQFSFPLNLAGDSAFAKLTGHTSVVITVQPSTEVFMFDSEITNRTISVRGLLFFSDNGYRLVAERLTDY